MCLFPSKFLQDYEAMFHHKFSLWGRNRARLGLFGGQMLMILFGRLSEGSGIHATFFKWLFLLASRRRGIQMSFSARIGGGFCFAHAYGITVNGAAVLGEKVMLFKGSTIGDVRSGRRKGAPKIGNRVVVGLNSTVVGGVTIGDDVMIAPNTFVNFDVPSNSIVLGSPGVIHHKDKPCKDYFK